MLGQYRMTALGRLARPIEWFALTPRYRLLVLLLGAIGAGGIAPASAHDFTITATTVRLAADGGYQIDMTCDLDALALGAAPATDSTVLAAELRAMPPETLEATLSRLHELFQKRVRVRFDGVAATPVVTFPEYRATPSEHSENPSVLGVTARLSGVGPHAAKALTFWASRAFQAVHLSVIYEAACVEEPVRHILAIAEESPPIPLVAQPRKARSGTAFLAYLRLGFVHIVPRGVDHILFVLGLFLLSTHWRPLLAQVTAFTIAHSLTLALSLYGVVSLPSRLVEPLIALSIAIVAIENLATSKLHVWRTAVVFGFGLLHGLGFAGVLGEIGLPRSEYLPALLMFNLGVEGGQLAVIAAAFLIVGWWRSRSWYRMWIALPISGGIAAVGLYAAIQRAFLVEWPTIL